LDGKQNHLGLQVYPEAVEIIESNDEGNNFIRYPRTQGLDPRLDWSVGRRGIPFLDWGDHPGKDWIRNQENGGPYSPKKNTYYQVEEGISTDASSWTAGSTANNVRIIRLAHIILWRAEVAAQGK
jgi:hypothetical protein